MKLAILAAMTEELQPFREFFKPTSLFSQGKCIIETATYNKHDILLVETGIGKANAAFSTTLLCHINNPDLIINTGSAGGLSSTVSIGDVVFGNEFIYSDVDATGFDYNLGQVPQMPANYLVEQKYIDLFKRSQSAPHTYNTHVGQILTSDSFMDSPEYTTYVSTQFPKALASDMEGTSVAQVASFYDIPTLNIRSISDIAGDNAAQTFDNELDVAAKNAFQEVITFCRAI